MKKSFIVSMGRRPRFTVSISRSYSDNKHNGYVERTFSVPMASRYLNRSSSSDMAATASCTIAAPKKKANRNETGSTPPQKNKKKGGKVHQQAVSKK